MNYFNYREHKQQGTFDFPIAFYHIEPSHPRYQMPYHWHPEYEIIRILKGKFHLTLGGSFFHVEEGDILFIQDGVLHGGIPEDCIYECIVFDMKLLLKENNICTKQTQKIIRHDLSIYSQLPKDLMPLQKTIRHLFMAMAEKKTGYEFMTQGYLYQLLGLLFQYHLYEEDKTAAHVENHVLLFKKVLSYIEENFTEHITLEDMAKVAGMNAKYFCRFFREMSFRTPIDYLNYYRIECACAQLVTTKATIIEAAFNCGFNDISYFIKTFRKYKGTTPKQYLKKDIL